MRQYFSFIPKVMLVVALLFQASAGFAALDPKKVVLVINRDSHDIVLLDIDTYKEVGRVAVAPWSAPHMGMITHDGRKIVVSETKVNTAAIIDFETLKIEKHVECGLGPEHFDVSMDSRYVYMNNIDEGSISVIDLQTNEEVKRLEGMSEPHNVTFLPDGTKAYIANLGAHEVAVVDAKRHEVLKRLVIGKTPANTRLDQGQYLGEINGIINVTLSLDGKYGYAADIDRNVVGVIDTRTDSIVDNIAVGEGPWRAYVSPNGKQMWVPCNGSETVAVIDTDSRKLVAELPAGSDMTGINFSGESKKAYVISSSSGTVFVYSTDSLTPIKQLHFGQLAVLETAAGNAAGSKLYLASSKDNTIYVIDTKTDQVTKVTNVGQGPWGTHVLHGENYCH